MHNLFKELILIDVLGLILYVNSKLKDRTDNKRFGCDYHQYSLIKNEAPYYELEAITIKVCMDAYSKLLLQLCNLGFIVAICTYCIMNSAITKFGLCVDC